MKKKDGKPKDPPLTFEEAMRKIVNTPREAVEDAIQKAKKQPRGKSVKRDE